MAFPALPQPPWSCRNRWHCLGKSWSSCNPADLGSSGSVAKKSFRKPPCFHEGILILNHKSPKYFLWDFKLCRGFRRITYFFTRILCLALKKQFLNTPVCTKAGGLGGRATHNETSVDSTPSEVGSILRQVYGPQPLHHPVVGPLHNFWRRKVTLWVGREERN